MGGVDLADSKRQVHSAIARKLPKNGTFLISHHYFIFDVMP
jgi:hypothetical protein